jgi:transposase
MQRFAAGASTRSITDNRGALASTRASCSRCPSALAGWVKRARADRDGGQSGLTTDERTELAKLRKENRELKMERELLKKWAAFFAKESA